MKKSVSAVCIASLLSVAAAGVANAAPHPAFAPPTLPSPPWSGADYIFTGPVNVKAGAVSIACTWSVKVRVPETVHSPAQPPPHGDTAQIVSAVLTGGPSGICAVFIPTGMPWILTPTSLTSATVTGFGVNTPIGNCGPGTLNASWTNGPPPTLTFTNQSVPGCQITGVWTGPSPVAIISVP